MCASASSAVRMRKQHCVVAQVEVGGDMVMSSWTYRVFEPKISWK